MEKNQIHSSISRVKRRQQEKVLRFSIRKYSFGAASVAVAALMFLGARVVSADNVTPVDQPQVEASAQGTSSLESKDKEDPASSVKVDTATASQLVAQIKDQLHIKETANTNLLVAAKEELVKAEQTLANAKVSQEEVDALAARLTNVLEQLRAAETPQVKEEEKNDRSAQGVTPEIKLSTSEISAKSEETSENTNAEQLEKAKASLKVSIDRLEQAIAQTPENDLTREILEKANAQVAVAKSAFGGVEVSLRDVEDMNRVIKRNESSVMIARNRLTSGHNDVRNGAAIPVGTTLRAADEGATYDNAVGLYFTKEGDGSGYPAGTMLFRDRNQNTADNQKVSDVKNVVKVDVTKNGDIYDWVIEFDRDPEGHKNAHAWFTIPTGHELVNDGSASFASYWAGDPNKVRIDTQGRKKIPRTLQQIFQQQLAATSKVINIGTPGGYIETADGKKTNGGFWSGSDGVVNTLEDIIANPNTPYWHRTGGARTTTDKDVLLSDYLKDWLIQHTQKVYHFEIDYRSKIKESTSNYIFRFKTKAAEGTPLFYAAGMRSYEFNTHRNDMQWYGLPSPKVTGADQTIEKGKEIRLEFTTKDNLAGFSLGDPKLGYNTADSIKLVDSELKLDNQKVEVQKVSDYEHKLIITGRVASDPSDTGYHVKVMSVNNVGQSAEFTSTVKVTQSITPTLELNQDPKTGDVTVTPKKPDGSTYPSGTKVEIPGENGTTIPVEIGDNGSGKVSNDKLPKKDVPGTGKITEPGQPTVEVPDVTTPAKIKPRDTTPPKIYWLKDDGSRQELGYTHAAGQNVVIPLYRGDAVNTRLITIDDSGKVTDFRLENLQSGFSFTPVNGTATEESPLGQNVTGKVGLEVKKGKYTARAISTDGTNSTTGYFVFEIHEQAEKYPLEGKTETVTVGDSLKTWKGRVDSNQYTEAPKGRGVGVEWGWKGEAPKVVQDTAGVFKYTATATHPDKSVAESNPQVTIIVKPKAPTIETDLTGKAEVPNTEVVVNVHEGVKDGSTVTLYSPEGRAIGTGTVTNGKAKITGTIPVGNITAKTTVQTPGQPNVESELSPIKVATKIAETEKPGKIEITQQPNGDAVVTPKKPDGSTYPPGTKVEIPGENGTTIPVEIGDNGSGKVPNDKLPKTNVPGTGKITEPGKPAVEVPNVTTPAKVTPATPGQKTPTVDVEQDPKTGEVTVTPKKPDGSTFPPGTKVEIPGENGTTIPVEIGDNGSGKVPNDKLPKTNVPGTGKITEPGKPAVEVPNVTTPAKVTPATPGQKTPTVDVEQDPKTGEVTVTPKKPDGSTFPPGTKVEIPGENGTTIPVEIGDNGSGKVPNDKLPKTNVPGTGKITEPGKPAVEVPNVTTPAKVTPATPGQKTPTVDVEQDPKTGEVTVTPKKPDGSTFPPGTKVEIPGENGTTIPVEIGDNGSGKVPNDKLPKTNVPGKGTVTEPNKKPSQPVDVTTPARKTPTVDVEQDPKTGDVTVTPKKPDGTTFPPGTKVEIPGENGNPITVTIGQDGKGKVPNDNLPKKDVPGTGTVTEPNKKPSQPVDVTTPARKTPTIDVERDPKTGDVTVTPKKPDGSTFPPGTKVEIPGENGNPITVTIGKDGKGKVPNDNLPKKDVPGTGKITEPGKPTEEVPNVTTPGKFTPETPVTEKPVEIEITRKPNGDAIVTPKKPDGSTYPSGSKVVIPGENGTPITVTIGDNGSGEVPNDNLPKKDVPGTGTVTEPNKKPSQPVDVTTPARKTPTIDVERDPKTGEVTVTPKKPDGSTFPPGTKVEIPGENGNPITVTIGKDGKGKVPNDNLPKKDVPGTGKITEPGKPTEEVPNVTTPGKFTPETPVTEKPVEIEITRKPNGDAIVTPKKPDGSTYPSGSKVVIPGENGTPITVTIGDNGSGEVPNDNLPKKDVPGTGTVTEPNKKPSQPVDVTTPARKTPTIDVERDPKTGDVTVTPKKPDGSTFPPGTKVEIPGENGNPITVTIGKDGKGKVPNDNLPKKDVPGTGKITEPGKPTEEVPNVTTPGKFTPETPVTEKPGKIEITQQPNGNAIVTPKKPDGTTYPSGSKVEIPGEDGPITVTIGDNGSGEVPNDKLPKTDAPGKGTVTEPNKKPSQPVDVTTPARKTPTVDVEQDPKTGDVTVTPKKPDGTTFPPGTKVEIPGENGNPITVTIGQDGKGKVPNDNLPKKDVPGTGTVTEPNKKPSQPVDVTTPARKTPTVELERDPKTGDVTVTPKKPDGSTFPPGTKVEIPGENGTPITVTIGKDGKGKVPNDNLPKKDVPGTGKITEPGKPTEEVPNVTTPGKFTPETPVTEKPVEIEITRKPNGDAIVTPKKPDGKPYPSGSKVVIPGENGTPITVTIGDNGSGEVPNDNLPKKDVPGTGTVTEPNKKPSQPVDVTTPAQKTPTLDVEQDPKTGEVTVTPKKPDGSTFPPGTKVEIPGENGTPITVTIGKDGKGKVPNDNLPKKDVPGTGKITEPGKPTEEVPNVTTPGKFTPETPVTEKPVEIEITRKPNGDAIVTPKKPDGKPYPSGSKVVIPGENNTPIEVTIGDNGSGEVPNDKLPKTDVPGTGKITEPGKPTEEVPNVTTPGKFTPETPVTEKPGKIEITQQPNGNAIVTPKKPDGTTYPSGSKVEIPGEDGPITVTIGDNGSGEVPNDKLPKTDAPGKGTVTEPNKKPSQPVDVTTPARKTPTVDVEQDPKTGDVTVTPKKPDGTTFPPGTKVEIPGENGNPITVTIGQDGKGKVPNDNLPKKDVPGTGKITEPGKPTEEVPNVTTPGKFTPETPVTEKPVEIEITRKPNGDAIVTPKKPDGKPYPSGSKVVIPGENGTPITVTIGDNGSGEVPNDNLPKKDVPGTGTVTEPNKKPSQPVDVTTPAQKTPTLDVEQDPKTGEVTVTPKKPDGSTFPPGTKVEIPGENGTPITVTIGKDGKGKVPNDNLPKKDVPGTGKITEPGKPTEEVPNVTTPGKFTPETPVTEKPVEIEITRKPNGDAIVTPKKPDGKPYPSGSKVVIPGENNTPIEVTIGDNGSGEVPNDKLPKTDVPGTGKITEPGKPTEEVPNVTTPGKFTPETPVTEKPGKIEITQQPNGNAIVTPKKPDGTTYPSGSKVEIPGEDGPITVTIGDNGSGEVPNDKLPKTDAPGKGTVTEPNKKPSQPVDVTTPARKTPTVDVEQDPKTGDVTVTPKKPDGTTFPPGTKVEIPGENGNPITVTIGQDGKGKVPNDNLPKKDVPGTGKITEPGKPTEEVPNVTTPGKFTPETPVTEKPVEIEITRKPNGDAIVTPKKPDGKPYPSGSKVVIPGENGTPITVTIGDNGSGEVPNDNLPKKDVPGTGTVTEPNKKPSQPVDVTTPARKTPTVELERDPKTGDVTVTPKKPDGSTYPPGTKVEIPGKDGPITVTIGEDGKGKVPNSDLPEGKVSGPGKITEPNKPAVEVPKVETPGKVTPETPVAPVTPDTNGAKSNDSQKVLPNTGTESNATLASLGLLGILGGLGLALGKKKED